MLRAIFLRPKSERAQRTPELLADSFLEGI
jgi:hypothetical protein